MKNYFKLIFLLIFASSTINASVVAKVDTNSVEIGDSVSYSLDISGENIQRPDIQKLCGTDVVSTASQTSMRGVNGKFKKSYILSYDFLPQQSCIIEPIEVEVNGKIERSNSVSIKVNSVEKTKDLDFILTLNSDKKELFVGETFELTLIFKQKLNSQALDSQFTPPELKGFWIKNEPKAQKSQDKMYETTKIIYKLAPQREGKLTISKAQIKVASKANTVGGFGVFMQALKWKTYFSNDVELIVKPLPSGTNLIGDFTIKAIPDRLKINAGDAINVKIEVLGSGNLEDIRSFKQSIDGVNVFDEKIIINDGRLTQNLTFVADRDFVIPAFTIKYFDTKAKDIKTVSSGEIAIKVNNAKAKEDLVIKKELKKEESVKRDILAKSDSVTLVITFLVGLISGILIMLFKIPKIFKKEKSSFINEPKLLLVKLLPYKNSNEVREIIEILENNIYSTNKQKIDKKRVREILKRHKID